MTLLPAATANTGTPRPEMEALEEAMEEGLASNPQLQAEMTRVFQEQDNGKYPPRLQYDRRQQQEGLNLLFNASQSSILTLYFSAHASHSGQCPKSFHLWSCVSMLAALAQDKWWFQRSPGVRMLPNQYIMLVAPSGSGKDTAMGVAMDYLRPYRDLVRSFAGRLTHASFMDFLCMPRNPADLPPGMEAMVERKKTGQAGEEPVNPKYPHSDAAVAWLLTPELKQSLSVGAKASELIAMLTAIYTSSSREFQEHTRQWGYKQAPTPCVNWLGGSTQEWLVKAVGLDDIKGGFASRILWLIEDFDASKMCGFFVSHPELAMYKAHIEWRLEQLAEDEGGEMLLHPGAKLEVDRWFAGWKQQAIEHQTNEDGDKNLLPLFARGMDMALKLSMILRIADYDTKDRNRLVIKQNEMYTAVRWVEELLLLHYPRLLRLNKTVNPEIGDEMLMARIIYRATQKGAMAITRHQVMLEARKQGLMGNRAHMALQYLWQDGAVVCIPRPGIPAPGQSQLMDYAWVGDLKEWRGAE